MRTLPIAPRASKCMWIGPPSDCAALARRGTRRWSPHTASSGSTAFPERDSAAAASNTAATEFL
eukprot:scaffold25972_cov32-Tisochrysis_lutea.AAC.1